MELDQSGQSRLLRGMWSFLRGVQRATMALTHRCMQTNILNERYAAAMACTADKFEEMVQEFKQKQHGGDIDLHAVVAMSE